MRGASLFTENYTSFDIKPLSKSINLTISCTRLEEEWGNRATGRLARCMGIVLSIICHIFVLSTCLVSVSLKDVLGLIT